MRYEEFKEKGWLAPVSAVRNGEWTDGRIIETLWDSSEDEVHPSPGQHPMIVVVSPSYQRQSHGQTTSTVSNWRVTTLTATSRCTACPSVAVVTRSCLIENRMAAVMKTVIDLETIDALLETQTTMSASLAEMTDRWLIAERENCLMRDFLRRLGFDPKEICKGSGEESGRSCKVVSMGAGR